jgi:hypothetical protein
MTSWLLIRRLRGPAFLLLIGVMALLHEWAGFGFTRSWPLLLILAGLLSLAERAALAQANREDYDPITGQPRPPDTTIYGGPGSSIVPASAAPITPMTPPGSESGTGRS